ncbi:TonB-dependent receptor [Roseivirga sp. E12]|uniref:TonB-dependent receptor n=1 Tax=Roseivirga sp. E12 TaxID=2819237 RepID=UPI001ABD3F51|nr:TonB-dependent receptor [Roseivirga sp. E12]MBO3699173.1 TonB-dependent receptor [Roseivirga sp. E12]
MRNVVFTLGLLFLGFQAIAQSGQVTGTIVDETGEPLMGANVLLVEASQGSATNKLGKFYLENIDSGKYQLQVSFIGFEKYTKEIIINDQQKTEIDVALSPVNLSLKDVEVRLGLAENQSQISAIDVSLRPIKSSQDVLQIVPGLFIAQHAGGGKAEQIFLRGFDIDHGTDIALTVDGMPVNMVSHAHGQGYSDLHFVIPETIEKVDFDKGPYYADKGNLNTAGFASFSTKKRLNESLIKVEGGQFNTFRGVGLFNLLSPSNRKYDPSLYLATEYAISDGYFESPQNFNRFNALLKYNQRLDDRSTLEISASAFRSRWSASGQIPQRAIDSGEITRFGAIDDTEGGQTSRYNFNAQLISEFNDGSFIENQFFLSKYDFNLVSNFTFFLNDPVFGDQITQSESRTMFGSKHSYWNNWSVLGLDASTEIGIGFRHDLINDNRLSRTFQKNTILEDLAFGDIRESNIYLFAKEQVSLNSKLELTAGLRYDWFRFQYMDKLAPSQPRVSQGVFSPKLKLSYAVKPNLNLFLKSGIGFHSNDSRVVVARSGEQILPKAYGLDIGSIWKPSEKLLVNLAFWRLNLDQEFVYVGDEGIVEAGGKTTRQGLELGLRYQLTPTLYASADVNYTDPKAVEEAEGQQYIPLAPTFTSIGSLIYDTQKRFSGSLSYRLLGDRSANEDKSLIADGYFLLDISMNYRFGRFEFGLTIENLLNREWKEAQFETESRLFSESSPTSEIHFTPGTPFQARLSLGIKL